MAGVDDFVIYNDLETLDSTFDSCLSLIVFAYHEVKKGSGYKRSDILGVTKQVRRKETSNLELEDYLRNDLVSNYINPNRVLFGLDCFQFHSGVEEFDKNIKVGVLDIKVTSPLLDGTEYYIFECKRMNKAIANRYVTEGLLRFSNAQYYPESSTSKAGMISFLESEKGDGIECATSFMFYSNLFDKYAGILNPQEQLVHYKIKCDKFSYVSDYEHVFYSSYKRDGRDDIGLYHIVLDYQGIVQ